MASSWQCQSPMDSQQPRNHLCITRLTHRILLLTLQSLLLWASCTSAFVPVITLKHVKTMSTSAIQQQQTPVSPFGVRHHLHSLTNHQSTQLHLSSAAKANDYNSEDDEKTWKAVFVALQLYKAAYQDLKVPQRFVVPDRAPWPKPCWNMKLGRIVSDIRATGKYLLGATSGPLRRQQLEELGFVWRMRQSSTSTRLPEPLVPLDQLYEALQAYRKIVVMAPGFPQDSMRWGVSSSFVIPNVDPWPELVRGLPLGQQVNNNLRERLNKKATLKRAFIKLGLAILQDPEPATKGSNPVETETSYSTDSKTSIGASAIEERFKVIITALRRYKELYGDLMVPQPFRIPDNSDEWPEETWGVRLGARVNAIRSQGSFVNNNAERRHILDNLGFIWTMPKERARRRDGTDTPNDKTTAASNAKEEEEVDFSDGSATDSIFDDEVFDFESSFEFPGAGESESPSWGFEDDPRQTNSKLPPAQMQTFNNDEYIPPPTFNETLEKAYKRALDVGIVRGMTENKRIIKGIIERDIPWFNDDFGDDFVFEDVVEALTTYKKLYGDFSNLTEEFVVPSPKEITGFLGDEDDDSYGQFDIDQSALMATAFARFGQDDDDELDGGRSQGAAELWQMQEDRSRARRQKTAVVGEPNADEWPEHLAGMTLGTLVARIQDGSLEVKHLPERKAQLDAIGFDWGDPERFIDVPFEKSMCAFLAYYMIRGDMLVPEDFVMPDEDPWPHALGGYEIGQAVKRIRELQMFFDEYHPEKISLLRIIEFMWFPMIAHPLRSQRHNYYYYYHDDDDEYSKLRFFGHPDMETTDMPLEQQEKIRAAGPFFETDDPQQFWRRYHNWDYVKDYWYERGRRDNAFYLRESGYPRMAEEHEAKYGPGLFTQINETREEMKRGFDGKSQDELREILNKLDFYRTELVGCTDISDASIDALMDVFDARMIEICKIGNLERPWEIVTRDLEPLKNNGASEDDQDEGDENEEDVNVVVEEYNDLDIEDELGLDDRNR